MSLLLLPALFATWSYASALGDQTAFAASERAGVTVVRPAVAALAELAAGRPLDLDELRTAVQDQPQLGAQDALDDVLDAADAGDGSAQRAATAQALAALVTHVGDTSNLILDPDLDSFYVMDTLVVQLPKALVATAGTAAVDPTQDMASRVAGRAVLSGGLSGAAGAMHTDVETAVRTTSRERLEAQLAFATAAADRLSTLAEQLSGALDRPADGEQAAREQAGAAAAQAVDPVADELDALLAARADALSARRTITLAVTAAGLALALWVAAAVLWRTTTDVGRILAVAGAIGDGDGDLHARALPAGEDELGDVGRALDAARQRLQLLLRDVDGASGLLRVASGELVAVSEQVRLAAGDSAAEARSVALDADGVSAGVDSVRVGTSEMAAAVQDISVSAAAAARIAAEGVAIAEAADVSVTQLGQSSTEIAGVLAIIGSIADQTNLLALNATIEAARAGQYGRGFAVVAQEVKDLARQTSTATGDVGRKVAAIQQDAAGAVDALRRMHGVTAQISDHQAAIAAWWSSSRLRRPPR